MKRVFISVTAISILLITSFHQCRKGGAKYAEDMDVEIHPDTVVVRGNDSISFEIKVSTPQKALSGCENMRYKLFVEGHKKSNSSASKQLITTQSLNDTLHQQSIQYKVDSSNYYRSFQYIKIAFVCKKGSSPAFPIAKLSR